MLKYLLESFKNKKNRPMSFFVNWLGLNLGMVAVVVAYLYVAQELRYDKGGYAGTLQNAMIDPNSAIISRAAAVKLFDTEDVIGRVVKINNQIACQISAVGGCAAKLDVLTRDYFFDANEDESVGKMELTRLRLRQKAVNCSRRKSVKRGRQSLSLIAIE